MLRELHISNLAVIADARIELDAGLNCFTGATGAGKSLVLGAVEVLLGLRSPSEMLRAGADEGRVTGLFEMRDKRPLQAIERLSDVPVTADGGELLITRRLHASGRTSVSLNGHPITLGMLRHVAELLVDVHGQHDHQYLLRSSNQLDVIDSYGELWPLREKYHEAWLALGEAKRQLDALSADRTLREQQLELYRFQADEIDAAELDAAEYEELRARASVLENLEKLKKEAGGAHAALYEAEGSVLERLKMIAAVLMELSALDLNLKPLGTALGDATLQLEDSAFDLGRYLGKLDLDPTELVEVNERLNTINRILNKYGDPVEAAIAYRADVGRRITELEKQTDDFSSLQDKVKPLQHELQQLGAELTRRRHAAAAKLAPLIEKELVELGMEKARLTIAFAGLTRPDSPPSGTERPGERARPGKHPVQDRNLAAPEPQPGPSGFDQVEFIIQTNPGLTPQPLRKIASGGELSRIMLALKGVLAQGDRVSVLVFDEIDANVGGRLGSIIGSKLRRLAVHHQVLCITHLPQIASYASRHLTVRKQMSGTETHTSVRQINGSDRVEELAEMIGGQRITDTTRTQARELLDTARAEPASITPAPARRRGASRT
jgi:DNA repair protein RecN (Recombination protein N)